MATEAQDVWTQTVSYISQLNNNEQVPIINYLSYLTPEVLSNNELVLSTTNSFVKGWIEKNYYNHIQNALFDVVGIDMNFRIVANNGSAAGTGGVGGVGGERAAVVSVGGAGGATAINLVVDQEQARSVQTIGSAAAVTAAATAATTTPTAAAAINEPTVVEVSPKRELLGVGIQAPAGYVSVDDAFGSTQTINEPPAVTIKEPEGTSDERSFDSFVVGDSNRFAFSAALGVAKSPGNIYNPLFIYGGSGLGKTHLLLAIENYIREKQPHLKTTYAQTSDFVRDFTQMLTDGKRRQEFDRRYHQVDIILLDDVQYLEGKIETTGEVFQIFNDFTMQNKQIVLSADRPPKNIQLDERYKSRFASGCTIDIQPPNFETKYAIFENYLDFCCRKLERMDIKDFFSQEIVDHIIEVSSDNIRELEGAIATLVSNLFERQKQRRFEALSMDEVERIISNVFMRSAEKRINIAIIQKEIEHFYHLSHDDLIGKKRSQGITYPRQVAMYLSREMTNESFPDIGKAFGDKDHTTVMYACNNIEKKRQLSKTTENEIKNLVELIKK